MRSFVPVILMAGLAAGPIRAQPQATTAAPTAEQLMLSDIEVRRLISLMRLEPGVTVADVGAGLGAWSLRFAQWTGTSGRVYATEITEDALAALQALVVREQLTNVTVLAGSAAATNLPAGCCDVILMRNVFHYVTEPAAMIRSLEASLKPGGRLAIAGYPPRPNSTVPAGVPANRGGIGIPPGVLEREVGEVLRHVTTVLDWAPEGVPASIPPEVGRPYVSIFEKAR